MNIASIYSCSPRQYFDILSNLYMRATNSTIPFLSPQNNHSTTTSYLRMPGPSTPTPIPESKLRSYLKDTLDDLPNTLPSYNETRFLGTLPPPPQFPPLLTTSTVRRPHLPPPQPPLPLRHLPAPRSTTYFSRSIPPPNTRFPCRQKPRHQRRRYRPLRHNPPRNPHPLDRPQLGRATRLQRRRAPRRETNRRRAGGGVRAVFFLVCGGGGAFGVGV